MDKKTFPILLVLFIAFTPAFLFEQPESGQSTFTVMSAEEAIANPIWLGVYLLVLASMFFLSVYFLKKK